MRFSVEDTEKNEFFHILIPFSLVEEETVEPVEPVLSGALLGRPIPLLAYDPKTRPFFQNYHQ